MPSALVARGGSLRESTGATPCCTPDVTALAEDSYAAEFRAANGASGSQAIPSRGLKESERFR